MKKRWFWRVGLVDQYYGAHLALDLAKGDRAVGARLVGLPLFTIATQGARGLASRAPRNAA